MIGLYADVYVNTKTSGHIDAQTHGCAHVMDAHVRMWSDVPKDTMAHTNADTDVVTHST